VNEVLTPWEPEVLARIHHLDLVARRVVEGVLHGAHKSRRIGPNVEFADYKDYSPGDPLRDLDWRVLARSDRLVVKRYEAETELACTLVLDASGDTGTGDQAVHGRLPPQGSKLAYGVALAATLAYFLSVHGEPVGLAILGGENVRQPWIPPRGGRQHLALLFASLASVRAGGRADLAKGVANFAPRVPRRGLVALITDFMEDAESWSPALRGLARRRADLVAFHLLDRKELSLDYDRPLVVFSPEGGQALPIDPGGDRGEFNRVVSDWFDEVRGSVVGQGGRYFPTWTDLPLEDVLRRVIHGLF
jgi:uncharacterized protein (DUF58 family)